jgi:hypothetical protein
MRLMSAGMYKRPIRAFLSSDSARRFFRDKSYPEKDGRRICIRLIAAQEVKEERVLYKHRIILPYNL